MAFWDFDNSKVTVEKTVKELALSSYRYSNELNSYNFESYIKRFGNEELLSDIIRRFASRDMDFSIHMDFITNMYETICINRDKVEEKTIFDRLFNLYIETPEVFIYDNNFNKVASSFYDKQIVLEYFRYVLGNEKVTKGAKIENLSKVIGYVCAARQYYVDDRALLASAINLIDNFDPVLLQIGNIEDVEKVIEQQLSQDKKSNGIYDFDQSTIAELDAKVNDLDAHGLQLSGLISLAQEQITALKQEAIKGREEITSAKVKTLTELEAKVNSLAQNFDQAYTLLLSQERDSLATDREAILAQFKTAADQAKTDLRNIASGLSQIATTEVRRIKETGSQAEEKVKGIVDNNEELQKLIYGQQNNESVINVLTQLSELGPDAFSRLLGLSATGVAPNGVAQSASSVLVAPEIIRAKEEEIVDPTVNYYFDETVPFRERYNQLIELKNKDIRENGAIYHEKFDEVLVYVLQGDVPYLYGPAGVGKSYLAKQIFSLINLAMIVNGFVEYPQDLLGYTNAADGGYVASNFQRCYKYGKAIFLDELDNGQPKGTITLNRFIDPDNTEYMFPDGKITPRHPNFRMITSGNTKGAGRTQVYNAREKIDGSVMDRLKVVEIGYDNRIEKKILESYPDWFNFAVNFRQAVASLGTSECGTFTTRAANSLKRDLDNGCLSTENIMESIFIKNKDVDTLRRITQNMESQLGNGGFNQGGKRLLKTFNTAVNAKQGKSL